MDLWIVYTDTKHTQSQVIILPQNIKKKKKKKKSYTNIAWVKLPLDHLLISMHFFSQSISVTLLGKYIENIVSILTFQEY